MLYACQPIMWLMPVFFRSALEVSLGISIKVVNSGWCYCDPWFRNSYIKQKHILLHSTESVIWSANCQVLSSCNLFCDVVLILLQNQNDEQHWESWSSGMWCCIVGYMTPEILKEHISLKCQEVLNQQCNFTFQKTGNLNTLLCKNKNSYVMFIVSITVQWLLL